MSFPTYLTLKPFQMTFRFTNQKLFSWWCLCLGKLKIDPPKGRSGWCSKGMKKICICVYIHIDVYLYIHTYIYLCIYIYIYLHMCVYVRRYIYISIYSQQTTGNCLRKSSVCVFRNPTGHSGTPCCSVFNFQLGTWVPLEKITACSNSGSDGIFLSKCLDFHNFYPNTKWHKCRLTDLSYRWVYIDICCMYILEAQPYSWMLVYRPKIILGCCLITWLKW